MIGNGVPADSIRGLPLCRDGSCATADVGSQMAEPRKVFRIEQTSAARRTRNIAPVDAASPHHSEIMQALGALQELMAAAELAPQHGPAAARSGGASTPQEEILARIGSELDAVIAGTARATETILTAAEEIDQLADNLSAALKGRIEQDLAQDIADSVLRIFEACNFQDLIGQRVTKVMKALKAEAAPLQAEDAAPELHGPRLDSDGGHMSQNEIDALFGG
jgi:chemotaxis protein CheZ